MVIEVLKVDKVLFFMYREQGREETSPHDTALLVIDSRIENRVILRQLKQRITPWVRIGTKVHILEIHILGMRYIQLKRIRINLRVVYYKITVKIQFPLTEYEIQEVWVIEIGEIHDIIECENKLSIFSFIQDLACYAHIYWRQCPQETILLTVDSWVQLG